MRTLDISFRQIRYFVCTAEMGQISIAAQELNITQSAITISIKDLENKLNLQLFVRSSKRMILTEAGKQFLGNCYDMLSTLERSQHLHNTSNEIAGELKIGASYTVLGYYLPAHLQHLQNMYPNVKFKIFEMERTQIEGQLIDEKLDMAVLLSSNVSHPKLQVKTFLQSSRNLWVSSNHPLLAREQVDYHDIANEPYIMLNVDEANITAQKHWQMYGISPNIFVETSSVEAVRSMVANGSGICILSNAVYRPWSLEGKRINRIKLTTPVPTMDLGVAWKAGKKQTRLQKLFSDYFLRKLEH